MNFTDFINNPTLRVGYVVNIVDVLVFFLVSLIIRYVVNKKVLKKGQKKQSNAKSINKAMLIILFTIIVLTNKKVYAIMAMSTYGLDIITIMINFIGIFITNFVIELIANHKDINRTKFFEIFSDTVVENIIFNITLIVCIMTTNVIATNYMTNMTINIIITVAITLLYKIIKLLLNKYSISKKILIVILYSLILFTFAMITNCNIRQNYDSKNGVFIERKVEVWNNGEHRIKDNISINYR